MNKIDKENIITYLEEFKLLAEKDFADLSKEEKEATNDGGNCIECYMDAINSIIKSFKKITVTEDNAKKVVHQPYEDGPPF